MTFFSIIYMSLLIVVGVSAIALVAIYRIDKNSK